MSTLLLCLAPDDDAEALGAVAERIAREMNVSIGVVAVSNEGERSCPPGGAWILRTNEPAGPLLSFARRTRARGLLVGPRAWERWANALRAASAAMVAARRL
ncbi:MAG: hypothetical protein SF051_01975 [Elusimicrobiota bacterium]|nr:hypothetical protein [Elusimicrobiota bacterium]